MINREGRCLIERGGFIKEGVLIREAQTGCDIFMRNNDKRTKVDRNTRLYFWCCIKLKKNTQTVLFYM